MVDFSILLKSIPNPPHSFAEAIYLLKNPSFNEHQQTEIYSLYLWLIVKYAQEESYEISLAYINELKGRAGLLPAQIKLLAKISEELEPQIVGSVPLTPTEALLVNRLSEGPVHAVDSSE